jgi:hypothetical protein
MRRQVRPVSAAWFLSEFGIVCLFCYHHTILREKSTGEASDFDVKYKFAGGGSVTLHPPARRGAR